MSTSVDVASTSTPVLRPTSTAEVAEVLTTSRGPVLVRGGGTKLDWGGAVELGSDGSVLDTSGVAAPPEHNPADLTVVVGAGTRLVDLQRRLGEADQWLPADPPSALAGATLGGLLASGEAGPSRLRHGPLRDLVIGSTLVLADGTVAHSGGHVIKNVAGYDLTKLAAGSLGSLFCVSELVLRVLPRPAATCTLAARADLTRASAVALSLLAGPLEPAALEWSGGEVAEGELLLRFDGAEGRLDGALDQVRRLPACTGLALVRCSEEEAAVAWTEQAARAGGGPGRTSVAVQGLPDGLPGSAAEVARVAARHGVAPTLAASLGTGTLVVGLTGGPEGAHEAVVAGLRSSPALRGSSLLLRGRRPDFVLEAGAALGSAPSTAALLRRLKAALDPDGRFAPGRFAPWY